MAAHGFVELDRGALQAHISHALDADPALPTAGAFLFGSALGQCRPDSDIDLGLVPLAAARDTPRWHVEGRTERLLGTFQGHVFDPNVLEDILFACEAVTTGRLVYVRDDQRVWDFVEHVTRFGWELRQRHQAAVDVSLAAMHATERWGVRRPERIAAKLQYLEVQIRDIRELLAKADPLTGDAWRLRGLRYAVHTAIDAMIDICYHLSARRLNHAPSTPHDALDSVVRAGLLPAGHGAAWHAMFRLRNILVHGDQSVSDAQLVGDVRAGLGDLQAFAAAVGPLAAGADDPEPGP